MGFNIRRRAPHNTEREVKESPLGFLTEAILADSPADAILAQEAAGQGSFVNSDTLPTEMSQEDRTALETAGVKFGEVVPDDRLFQYVELPAGWKKSGTSHSMWSDLLDEKGRKRAAIFYKAAFYDRGAHLNCNHRYNINIDYDRVDREKVSVALVKDGHKEVIYTTKPLPIGDQPSYTVNGQSFEEAQVWLEEHFPNWKDISAYWD